MATTRITPIDGLRAFAVLGVMWAHVWMFMGNPSRRIGGLDLQKIISFVGVGVDLFFVISGFCMYLMFEKKYLPLTANSFLKFVFFRWKRIAPVYYLGIAVYFISPLLANWANTIANVVAHTLFIQNYFDFTYYAPHFWSLATEWQFYLLIPLFFLLMKKIGATYANIAFIAVSLLARLYFWKYVNTDFTILKNSDFIILRLIEFNIGIIACQAYLKGVRLPGIVSGGKGFLVGLVISYVGRICLTTEVLNHAGANMFVIRALFTEPLMAIGFALMLYNAISEQSIWSNLLDSSVLQAVGKVSYSMYIWHWIICTSLVSICVPILGAGFMAQVGIFLLAALATFAVSTVSYQYLELPYFKKSAIPAKA